MNCWKETVKGESKTSCYISEGRVSFEDVFTLRYLNESNF